MASIKDIQYAIHGEQDESIQKKEEDYIPKVSIKESAPKDDGFVVYKLVKKNPSGVHVQAIDYVINPNESDKGPQMIRLLEGVPSIWAKDQKDLPESKIQKSLRFLEWPKGSRFMTVPKWDKAMIEFMELCRHNIQNPNRTSTSKTEFFKYDPDAIAKERLENELLEVKMLVAAQQQSFEKMKKHAFYLGIPLMDTVTSLPKSEEALRIDYLLYAKRDPKTFKESLDSKEVDIQFLVRNAIVDGKIDISRNDGRIYWGKNGGVICNIPKTEKPIPYLTHLALTNSKEGKEFKSELEKIVT